MRSGKNNPKRGDIHGRGGGGGGGHRYHHNRCSGRCDAPQHSSPHHRFNRPPVHVNQPPPRHTRGYTPPQTLERGLRDVGPTRGRAGDALHAPPVQPSPVRGDHLTQVCGGACNKTWRAVCFPLPFRFEWHSLFISCGYPLGD